MKIIIIICTYNRSRLLNETLNAILKIKKPVKSEWEILIINNNCTDKTTDIVRQYETLLPLTMYFEIESGLSNARNAGLVEAERRGANYVIWTDDDVLPSNNWLCEYEEAFYEYPDASVFGGTIDPLFEVTPPKWLLESWELVKSAYAVRQQGDQKFKITNDKSKFPFGANYCINIKDHIGVFYNKNIGVNKKQRLLGEETEVIERILSHTGKYGIWLPAASVRHFLGKERINVKYLLMYFIGQGQTMTLQQIIDGKFNFSKPPFFPTWVLRQIITNSFLLLYSIVFSNPNIWMNYLITLGNNIGVLKGSFIYRNYKIT